MVAQALPASPFQQGPPQLPSMRLNPVEMLDAIRQMAPQKNDYQPMYPSWYQKPKRPTISEVKQRADRLVADNQEWLNLIEITMAWLRHERVGMFPEDEEDRRNGLQEEWIDNALTAKNNTVIAKVASAKVSIRKRYHNDDLRRKAQMIEDAAQWLQRELALQWVQKGNRPLNLDEALLLAQRGMYVSRQVFDVMDPDMPLNVDLIEPTQCFPVWGGKRGLQEIYRVYRDTIGNVTASYGDLTKDSLASLTKKYGKDITDQTEVNIYEYWNTWDRVVLVDDQPIIPFTAHEYGYVPWTVQYGGYGDAMFTRTPGKGARGFGGTFEAFDRTHLNERKYRAVPLIYYDMRQHEMLEAIMGRIVTGFKKEVNPPIIRERSTMLAGTDAPEFSQAPGAVNEVRMGEERVSVAPQLTNSPITGMIVQTLQGQMTRTDPSINYNADKSNVTGAALSRMGDEGTEHILPIYQALEMAKTHQFSQMFQTIGNWGHMTKFGTASTSVRPLMVPSAKSKRQGEAPAFELSRELIDEVGPKVEVTFTRINPADWMGLFNAGKLGTELGAVTVEEIREIATGDTDFDSHFEKWMQEKATMGALTHPKYNEMFLIPGMLAEQIKESAGDPEMVKFWTDRLTDWQQMAMQQQQPQGPQGAGDPMAAMAGAQGNPMAPGPQAPPMGNGQTLPGAMGPGSQGGPVGRPQ